jgi:hypothetical protein
MLGLGFDLVGLSTATRYMRSPSAFSDASVKPSFLRTTPVKKPRTECCCHPVAFMIAAIVVPLGCLSSPRTVSCLVLPRLEPEATFPLLAAFFACLARSTFVLLGVLRCDIFQILSVATAHAPSPPKPHSGKIASGAGFKTRQKGPHQPTTLTLCSQRKSRRFCKEEWAALTARQQTLLYAYGHAVQSA